MARSFTLRVCRWEVFVFLSCRDPEAVGVVQFPRLRKPKFPRPPASLPCVGRGQNSPHIPIAGWPLTASAQQGLAIQPLMSQSIRCV